jgi:hypothetical protein
MGKKVFANNMEVVHKAGGNKVVAAFPDACMTPPGPPAGPMPVPYADTSKAGDLAQGSKDVKIGGQPASLHQKSHYKSSPLGNEAATRSFGASIWTASIAGKTCFQAASIDVKFEVKGVNRHLDLTTSNHGAQTPGTGPGPGVESMGPGGGESDSEAPKCPCCNESAHPNQLGPDGKLSPVVTQDEYYAGKAEYFTSRRDQMQNIIDSGKIPGWASSPGRDPNPAYDGLPMKDMIMKKASDAESAVGELRELTAANPNCPNLHQPPDVKCGTHLKPNGRARQARKKFDQRRDKYLRRYIKEHPQFPQVTMSAQVNHKTPLDAGGCPVSEESNLIPDPILNGPCARIEALQTRIQSF